MRILLVEDDFMNRELFLDILEPAGHTIVIETDGLDGRERALREPFDLIVLDIGLPRLSGDAVCRELRAQGVAVPILALSADALPQQIEERLRAGFDRYLTKPIAPVALREAVDELGRARA